MQKKPLVMLTNDDGIDAPGLHAIYRELRQNTEIFVVAPSTERSAVGHAITLSDPLRVWPYEGQDHFSGYAVNGTPADCVKIGYWAILQKKPDIVISGINLGSNTGINTIYSGTVSAATEGAILGIPSFAVSLGTYTNPNFKYAAKFSKRLMQILLEKGLPTGVYLNVNIPACLEKEIQGIAITRQGLALYKEEFDKRIDPHGRIYYWLTGQKTNVEDDPEVDDGALKNKMVTITPVHYDLTRYDFIEELKSWRIRH